MRREDKNLRKLQIEDARILGGVVPCMMCTPGSTCAIRDMKTGEYNLVYSHKQLEDYKNMQKGWVRPLEKKNIEIGREK